MAFGFRRATVNNKFNRRRDLTVFESKCCSGVVVVHCLIISVPYDIWCIFIFFVGTDILIGNQQFGIIAANEKYIILYNKICHTKVAHYCVFLDRPWYRYFLGTFLQQLCLFLNCSITKIKFKIKIFPPPQWLSIFLHNPNCIRNIFYNKLLLRLWIIMVVYYVLLINTQQYMNIFTKIAKQLLVQNIKIVMHK